MCIGVGVFWCVCCPCADRVVRLYPKASLLTLLPEETISHMCGQAQLISESPVSSLVITAEGQMGDNIKIQLQDLVHYWLTTVQENCGFPHSEGRKVSKYQNVREL